MAPAQLVLLVMLLLLMKREFILIVEKHFTTKLIHAQNLNSVSDSATHDKPEQLKHEVDHFSVYVNSKFTPDKNKWNRAVISGLGFCIL